MTLEEAAAQCRARKLGTSACLELLDASGACGDRLPTATAGASGVVFSCSSVPSSRKAAVILAEAESHATSGPPWLLIVAGLAAAGGVLYLATR